MKKLLIIAGLAIACVVSYAQGTINFANVGAGLNAQVFNVGGAAALAGTGFTAELLVGTAATSLTAVAGTTTFLTGANAGYFVGGTKALTGHLPGTNPFFRVQAWDNAGGTITTYAAASIKNGVEFQLGNAGGNTLGNPAGSPPTPPGTLLGMTSFSLVPEPSTWALGLLGGLALLLRRRK